MARIAKNVKEQRVRELVSLGYTSYDKINPALIKEFGSGIRKQNLQELVRVATSKLKKDDVEKYTPKKHRPETKKEKAEYVLFILQEVTPQDDYSDLLESFYRDAMKLTKEKLKEKILQGGKKQKGDKPKGLSPTGTTIATVEVNYAKSQQSAVKAQLISERQESNIYNKVIKLSRKKEIAAYLYTLQTVLNINVKSFLNLI